MPRASSGRPRLMGRGRATAADQLLDRAARAAAAVVPRSAAARAARPGAARAGAAAVAFVLDLVGLIQADRLQEGVEAAGVAEDLAQARVVEVVGAEVVEHGPAVVE